MSYRWIPNILTSTRIGLVPVFLYFLFSEIYHAKLFALIIFMIASLTDALDGKIARKHNIISKFGIFFDPLADKILTLSAFYAFMFIPILSNTVTLWMIILISFRDIIVTLLRTILQYKGITMITSKLGKTKTALQFSTIVLILLFLIIQSYSIVLNIKYNNSLYILMVVTSLITFYTGIHYFFYNYKILGNLILKK